MNNSRNIGNWMQIQPLLFINKVAIGKLFLPKTICLTCETAVIKSFPVAVIKVKRNPVFKSYGVLVTLPRCSVLMGVMAAFPAMTTTPPGLNSTITIFRRVVTNCCGRS